MQVVFKRDTVCPLQRRYIVCKKKPQACNQWSPWLQINC